MAEPAADVIANRLYNTWGEWYELEQEDEWPSAELVAFLAVKSLRDNGFLK
jgi:hypothetical protein